MDVEDVLDEKYDSFIFVGHAGDCAEAESEGKVDAIRGNAFAALLSLLSVASHLTSRDGVGDFTPWVQSLVDAGHALGALDQEINAKDLASFAGDSLQTAYEHAYQRWGE